MFAGVVLHSLSVCCVVWYSEDMEFDGCSLRATEPRQGFVGHDSIGRWRLLERAGAHLQGDM